MALREEAGYGRLQQPQFDAERLIDGREKRSTCHLSSRRCPALFFGGTMVQSGSLRPIVFKPAWRDLQMCGPWSWSCGPLISDASKIAHAHKDRAAILVAVVVADAASFMLVKNPQPHSLRSSPAYPQAGEGEKFEMSYCLVLPRMLKWEVMEVHEKDEEMHKGDAAARQKEMKSDVQIEDAAGEDRKR